MALSNHERAAFAAKLARKAKASKDRAIIDLFSYSEGISDAMDFVDSDGLDRLIELSRMVHEFIKHLSEKERSDRIAETFKHLKNSDDPVACLRRLGWSIEEAIAAGLVTDEDIARENS